MCHGVDKAGIVSHRRRNQGGRLIVLNPRHVRFNITGRDLLLQRLKLRHR